MNKISEGNMIIFHSILWLLTFPIGFLLIGIKEYAFAAAVLFFGPIVLGGAILELITHADVSINEENDIVTLKTVFKERKILITELEIKSHVSAVGRVPFVFHTNEQDIVLSYTRKNYDTILRILRIKNYKDIEKFIADVKRKEFFSDLV